MAQTKILWSWIIRLIYGLWSSYFSYRAGKSWVSKFQWNYIYTLSVISDTFHKGYISLFPPSLLLCIAQWFLLFRLFSVSFRSYEIRWITDVQIPALFFFFSFPSSAWVWCHLCLTLLIFSTVTSIMFFLVWSEIYSWLWDAQASLMWD